MLGAVFFHQEARQVTGSSAAMFFPGGKYQRYIGCFFLAGTYLAIVCLASALTKNQVIAFIVSVMILSPCACQALNPNDAIRHRLQTLYRRTNTMQDARMPQIDIRAICQINPRRGIIGCYPRRRVNILPR